MTESTINYRRSTLINSGTLSRTLIISAGGYKGENCGKERNIRGRVRSYDSDLRLTKLMCKRGVGFWSLGNVTISLVNIANFPCGLFLRS